jgi:hypothetical protein
MPEMEQQTSGKGRFLVTFCRSWQKVTRLKRNLKKPKNRAKLSLSGSLQKAKKSIQENPTDRRSTNSTTPVKTKHRV